MAQTYKPRLPRKIRGSRRVKSQAATHGARDPEFGSLADKIRKYLAETSKNPLRDAVALHGIIAEATPSEVRAKVSRSDESRPPSKAARLGSEVAAAITRKSETAKDVPPTESISERAAGRPPLSPELDDLLKSVLERPEEWLDAPNPRFHGVRPADLVGTQGETKIIDILRAVDQGLF